jgi:hypothetical protein
MIDLSKYYNTMQYSYNEVMNFVPTMRVYDHYCFAWCWLNHRSSNVLNAGNKQDRYYKKHGFAGLVKRINRVRKWYGFEPLKTGEGA